MAVPFLASMSYGRAKEARPHRFAYDYGSVDPGMFAPAPERNQPRRAPKRSIAYTIPQPDDASAGAAGQCTDADGHVLGVNALALSVPGGPASEAPETGGLLFSGGRDGVVKVWDLGFPLRQRDDGAGWSVDRRRARQQRPRTRLRASRAVHSDWVNDIVVANSGQTVISASSDQTVRAWAPFREGERPHAVGSHVDYVKALAYSEHRAMVVSGGLDRQIKLWDVGQARPDSGPICALQAFGDASPTSSVYTLACNAQGSLVVSGSPERVVRVWDTRAGRQLTTLAGHTDHIRAVLLSADSELVLSGSSDTTVKLWSMRMRRCLSTYSQHHDSVWALYASHPRFQTFYSASRDGLVAKTIGAGMAAEDGPPHRRPSLTPRSVTGDTLAGPDVLCVAVAQESQGVVRLVATDDVYIWTATKGTKLNRWLDVNARPQESPPAQSQPQPQPQRSRLAAAGDSTDPDEVTQASLIDALQLLHLEHRDAVSGAHGSRVLRSGRHGHRRNRTIDDTGGSSRRGQPRPLSMASMSASAVSPLALAMQAEVARRGTIDEADNEDQFYDAQSSDGGQREGAGPAALAAAAAPDASPLPESPLPSASLIEALSAARSPLSHPQQPRDGRPFSASGHRDRVLIPIRNGGIVPVRAAPDETIHGRHGIRHHRILPNKRHVLAQDTQGRISLWDLLLCRRIHEFPVSAEVSPTSARFPGVFGTDFETVALAIAGEPETVNPWCHVDTRTGVLTVHLYEADVWSAEVHVTDVDGVSQEAIQAMGDHERVNIGQWMLKRLFLGYARARVRQGPIAPQDAALLNRWAAQIPAGEVVPVRLPSQRPPQTPSAPQTQAAAPPMLRAATALAGPLSHVAHDEDVEQQRPAPSIASALVSTAAQLGLIARPRPPVAAEAETEGTGPPPGRREPTPDTASELDRGRGEANSDASSVANSEDDNALGAGSSAGSPRAPGPALPNSSVTRPDGSPRHQHSPSIDAAPPAGLQAPSLQQQPGRGPDADLPGGGSTGKFLSRLRSMRMRKQKSTLTTSTASGSPAGGAPTLPSPDGDSGSQQNKVPQPPSASRTASAPGLVSSGAPGAGAAPGEKAPPARLTRDEFAEWAGPRFPTDTERSMALLQATATHWEQLYSPVVCPRLPLPRNVVIQIFQENTDASEPYCIYRCTADTIASQVPSDSFMSAFCVTDDPLLSFELCMPAWLTDFLLFNRLPAAYQEPAKVAFVLSPSPGTTLPPLANPNARLVANRMLRARKLAIYAVERMGLPLMRQPPPNYVSAVEACMRMCANVSAQPAAATAVATAATDNTGEQAVASDASDASEQHTTNNAYASAFIRAGEVLSEVELAALDDVAWWQESQRAKGGNAPAEYSGRPELYLALFCKGACVSPMYTLSTIKANIWKANSDIQIHYEWADFVRKRVARAQRGQQH
ncbi:hypothetical protein LPJ61_000106 [Coemansia biformis]|uniref:WD40 repeat-like protein n=1 Tax=Coemansia biformis TaxID=1286918 RepID=A0A9W7YJ62_9FUNG|nr:hypothetical protein LPJ61_000106 [Coemansia biformis]